MKLCKSCGDPAYVCCDFCVHYDFNPDRENVYTDNGWCRKHKEHKEPEEMCDSFNCEDHPDNVKAKKQKERRVELSKKLNGRVTNH